MYQEEKNEISKINLSIDIFYANKHLAKKL